MVLAGDAGERVAVVDEVRARRRGDGCNRLRSRRHRGSRRDRSHRRCGRSRCGRMRDDQLLAGRERARALVAVGGEDRLRRDAIALGEHVERVAGADDDLGPAGRLGGRDRARRHGGRGLQMRLCRGRVGADAATASGHPATRRNRIGLRRGDRRRRQGLRLIITGLRLRPRILRQLTLRRRCLLHRAGLLRRERIGEIRLGQPRLHVGAAPCEAERDQRQDRNLRHAARVKQLGDYRHGYSLVRNRTGLLSKHVASK